MNIVSSEYCDYCPIYDLLLTLYVLLAVPWRNPASHAWRTGLVDAIFTSIFSLLISSVPIPAEPLLVVVHQLIRRSIFSFARRPLSIARLLQLRIRMCVRCATQTRIAQVVNLAVRNFEMPDKLCQKSDSSTVISPHACDWPCGG